MRLPTIYLSATKYGIFLWHLTMRSAVKCIRLYVLYLPANWQTWQTGISSHICIVHCAYAHISRDRTEESKKSAGYSYFWFLFFGFGFLLFIHLFSANLLLAALKIFILNCTWSKSWFSHAPCTIHQAYCIIINAICTKTSLSTSSTSNIIIILFCFLRIFLFRHFFFFYSFEFGSFVCYHSHTRYSGCFFFRSRSVVAPL